MSKHKEAAQSFLKMAGTGKVQEAYDQYVASSFIHHNQYFKGDRQSLLTAMQEASRTTPNKSIDVKHVYEDGDTVITHSLVSRQDPEAPDVVVVHIFRFEQDRIVELWDVGQPVSKDSPNATRDGLRRVAVTAPGRSQMATPGTENLTTGSIAIARAAYEAYVTKDRAALEALLARDFHFTSPLDNRLDRETYFRRCWPNSKVIEGFDFVHLVTDADRVFVTYEGRNTDGHRFRNTEILTIRDQLIVEVEVYFGWSLPHKAPQGGFVSESEAE